MEISIRLTPCIQPVRRAEKSTENRALLPVKTNNKTAKAVPDPKNTAAQEMGFLINSICNFVANLKHNMLKIGIIILVRIEMELLSLYVSAIYVGIQVVTPSRKQPCKTIASIIIITCLTP